MTSDREGWPQSLVVWEDLCEVVDQVRILLNRDVLEVTGLTLAENLVLCHVAMGPQQRLRMVDLADQLVIAKSAITKTVDRLEKRGMLRRERDPHDRRTVYAALTADGEKIYRLALPAYVESLERHFASRLSKATMQNLRRLAKEYLPSR